MDKSYFPHITAPIDCNNVKLIKIKRLAVEKIYEVCLQLKVLLIAGYFDSNESQSDLEILIGLLGFLTTFLHSIQLLICFSARTIIGSIRETLPICIS